MSAPYEARWAVMKEGQVAPPTLCGDGKKCVDCSWFRRVEKRGKAKNFLEPGRCGKVSDMNNGKRHGVAFDGKSALRCSQFKEAAVDA